MTIKQNDLETFRVETRAWLDANCPASQRTAEARANHYWGGTVPGNDHPDAKLWCERMAERGWTAPEWPEQYGGAGLSPEQAAIIKEEMASLGCAEPLYSFGFTMIGPVLLELGTEEQKLEFLPPVCRGEIRWCQGFSEPGAGSDLAGLQTSAVDKGDYLEVNGSKIWTTDADKADWMYILLRTDTQAPKHEGISFALLDMRQSGVEAQPISLLSGKSHFCQTFFDNVRVEKRHVIGEMNAGWSVGKRLLQHERAYMSRLDQEGYKVDAQEIAQQFAPLIDGRIVDDRVRSELVDHLMNKTAVALTGQRLFEEFQAGEVSQAAMVMKYAGTEEEKRKYDLLLALQGMAGVGWEGDSFDTRSLEIIRQWGMSRALTIAGGSSEIQLNIVAKRVLGLPD